MYKSKFTQKIILLSTLPVFLFSIFLIIVLFFKINELSQNTSEISEKILNNIYTQLLVDESCAIAEKVSLKFILFLDELNILRAAAQQLVDKKELHSLGEMLHSNSWIKNDFIITLRKIGQTLPKLKLI